MTAEHTAVATSVVRSLTGGRWTWPPVRVRERYAVRGQRFRLFSKPVRSITSIKLWGKTEELEFDEFANGIVELRKPLPGGRCGPVLLDVTYEYGSRPSRVLSVAIEKLADEMEKADTNAGNCRLPERVTSVSRQGVSWTLIDPQDFLDNGRTGVYEVDLAIKASGGSKTRARIFSPDSPVPDRISSMRLPVVDPDVMVVGVGESLTLTVDYIDPAGNPIDMTGGTARLLVKEVGSGDTIYTVDTGDIATPGEITMYVDDSVTATWSPGIYTFVIEFTEADGSVEWVHKGSLTVDSGG